MLSRVKHTMLGVGPESRKVFRGMRTLLWGAGGAKLLALISTPIITRLYSPEDFSTLALYTSFVIIGSSVLTLRYTQAIPLPKTEGVAFNLVVLCIKLVFILGLILTCVLFFYAESLFEIFSVEELTPWWWLVAIGVVGTSTYEIMTLWATRKGEFRILAFSQVFQSFSGALTKILTGMLSYKPYGLFVGQFFSQTAGILQLSVTVYRDYLRYRVHLRRSRQRVIAVYYRSFAYFRLPSQFLLNISMQAPVLMAASMYEKEDVGQLSLAMLALSLPISIIGQSVSHSYYSTVAKLGKNNIDKIKEVTLSTQLRLFTLALPVVLFGYLFLEYIFVYAFGNSWREAGQYASALSPYLLFAFTSAPLVQVLNVVSSQKSFLYMNVIRVLLLAFLYFYSKQLHISIDEYVFYFSLIMTVFFIAVSIYIFYTISRIRG